jgi:predicted amidophosphoribosyltransferase
VFVEPARRLTLQLKRRGRTSLAGAIGELAGLLARREGLATASTTVTWVPAGASARRAGFDHAALLAAAVARTINAPAAPLLRRAVDGPRQADVALAQRRENVAARFAARRANGHILVVDDVYTTGSTAEACAAVLRRAGATSVDVVTWARTLRRRPA